MLETQSPGAMVCAPGLCNSRKLLSFVDQQSVQPSVLP